MLIKEEGNVLPGLSQKMSLEQTASLSKTDSFPTLHILHLAEKEGYDLLWCNRTQMMQQNTKKYTAMSLPLAIGL